MLLLLFFLLTVAGFVVDFGATVAVLLLVLLLVFFLLLTVGVSFVVNVLPAFLLCNSFVLFVLLLLYLLSRLCLTIVLITVEMLLTGHFCSKLNRYVY